MAFYPIRCGGYLLLAVAGWAAGRWVWPGERGVDRGKVAGPGAGEVRLAAGPGHAVPPAKTAGVKPGDGKAAGREMRASGSDAGFRDRARQMALEPPPALTDFLAAVTDSEVLRATLLEDAVIWAFCREPQQGLLLLSSLAGREEIGALTEKALRFFPPKDLPVVLAWYHRLPEGKLKSVARTDLIKVLAGRDFRQAVVFVAAMPNLTDAEISERRYTLGQLGDLALHADQMAALTESSLGLSPGDITYFEEQLQQQVVLSLRTHAQEEVVEKLSGPEAGLAGLVVADFFSDWVKSDPSRAAVGLEKLPETKKSPELYLQFASGWAKGNVGMASRWVKDLPQGETKQGAVRGLVASLGTDYPVEAAIWAGTLTDSKTRFLELQRLLAVTSGPAADRLKAAVNGLNLTPAERADLNRSMAP